MKPSKTIIKLENVSKHYKIYKKSSDVLKQFLFNKIKSFLNLPQITLHKTFWALKNISFEIKAGDTVGIIGVNGAGKSTLLQLIAKTLSPSSGSLKIDGKVAAILELGSGFNPEYTGKQNVYISCSIARLTKTQTDDLYSQICEFSGIGDFINQPVKTYSSGMFVRLAFSINIHLDPEILIVDEAMAVGDISFKAKCMSAIKKLQQKGTTILFVSHDVNQVKSLCNKAIYLNKGEILDFNDAAIVTENYIKDMRLKTNNDLDTNSMTPLKIQPSKPSNKKVFNFRYGDGRAKITNCELLDHELNSSNHFNFNDEMILRIQFECYEDIQMTCNYYIMDSKKNLIIGSDLLLAGSSLINGKKNEKYIVEYKSHLPILEGDYSIQAQLVEPKGDFKTGSFLDVVDDIKVFKIFEKKPYKIWGKCFVENSVSVKKI